MGKGTCVSGSAGMGLCTPLFLIFLTLKLLGRIDWSWWWVTSPLWVPVAFLLMVATLSLAVIFVASISGKG